MMWNDDPMGYQEQVAADERWHLERLIKYGIRKEKIKKEVLEKHLDDPDIRDERRTLMGEETLGKWQKKIIRFITSVPLKGSDLTGGLDWAGYCIASQMTPLSFLFPS